mgnify:CR=1 FL=1
MKIIFPVILSLIAFSSVDAQKKTINGKKIKEIKEWKSCFFRCLHFLSP